MSIAVLKGYLCRIRSSQDSSASGNGVSTGAPKVVKAVGMS
jgi:hypothetical protein